MNQINFKEILKLNIKSHKSKIFLIAIMTSILIMTFLLCLFSHTFFKYIYNFCYNNYDNRTILVRDEGISEDKLETLYNTEHIISMLKISSSYLLIHTSEYEEIEISPINEKALPKITDGVSNLGNGNLICPEVLIPYANLLENLKITTDKSFTTKNLFNQPFTATFTNSIYDDNYEIVSTETMDKIFTIVGTYDSSKYAKKNNECFVSIDDYNEIENFYEKNDNIETHDSKSYFIIIDEFKNLNIVKEVISNLDLYYDDYVTIDFPTVSGIVTICIILLITFILVVYIIINFNIKKDLVMREKEILLYKSIGYSKKNIIKIYYLEYLINLIIILFISLVISTIMCLIIKMKLSPIALFQVFQIEISYIEYLSIIIIGIIYPSIIIISKLNIIINKRQIKL